MNSRETTRVADDESHRGWKVPRRQRCACEGQGDAARAGEATARARRRRGDAAQEREEKIGFPHHGSGRDFCLPRGSTGIGL